MRTPSSHCELPGRQHLVIANVEWRPGELFPLVAFVTETARPGSRVVSRWPYLAFQMTEVAIPKTVLVHFLRSIAELCSSPITSTVSGVGALRARSSSRERCVLIRENSALFAVSFPADDFDSLPQTFLLPRSVGIAHVSIEAIAILECSLIRVG